jgi:hypothetical protein
MTKTNQAVSQPTNQLYKFTETIKMELEVQEIHEMMMATLPEDYKHKEILSHAIIGAAAETNTLVYVWKALNGLSNEINYKVGDIIMCTEEERYEEYFDNDECKYRKVAIGECKVVEINLYKGDKLKVEFQGYSNYGSKRDLCNRDCWVSHKNCTKIPILEPEDVVMPVRMPKA